jgi:hypothetical protein
MIQSTITLPKVSFMEPGHEEDKLTVEKMDRAEGEEASDSTETSDEANA